MAKRPVQGMTPDGAFVFLTVAFTGGTESLMLRVTLQQNLLTSVPEPSVPAHRHGEACDRLGDCQNK